MFSRRHRLLIPFIATVLLLALSGGQASAVTIGFSEASYTVRPGDKVSLVVELSEPVANGLEGYALTLSYPDGIISVNSIQPVAELDFDLFEPGAIRSAGPTFASVAGYTELGKPAYTGTGFVVFNLTIRTNAPEGTYPLTLGPMLADAVNFVDGLGNPIDGSITFGSATMEILPPWPPEYIDDLRIDIVAGQAVLHFTGTPGRPYRILYSDTLQSGQWQSLGIFTAPANGIVEVTDTGSSGLPDRFYRVSSR